MQRIRHAQLTLHYGRWKVLCCVLFLKWKTRQTDPSLHSAAVLYTSRTTRQLHPTLTRSDTKTWLFCWRTKLKPGADTKTRRLSASLHFIVLHDYLKSNRWKNLLKPWILFAVTSNNIFRKPAGLYFIFHGLGFQVSCFILKSYFALYFLYRSLISDTVSR